MRPVVDELTEPVVDVLLQQLDLADVVGQQLAHDLVRLLAHLGEQLVALGEAAADQLGCRRTRRRTAS